MQFTKIQRFNNFHTWWNIIVDWCRRGKSNKSNVIFEGVWIPLRVSPSVVWGDLNPAFSIKKIPQKNLPTYWAHWRPWYYGHQAWCHSRRHLQHSGLLSAQRSLISRNLHRTWIKKYCSDGDLWKANHYHQASSIKSEAIHGHLCSTASPPPTMKVETLSGPLVGSSLLPQVLSWKHHKS